MLDSTFSEACETAARRWEVPAMTVGSSVDGRVETFAVGCDPDTRFRIASITKPFTATLALGLLDLETEVRVWPDADVRHLLSHTSGHDCECGDLARFGEGDEALAAAVAELPTVRRFVPAGEIWSYSNAGYWIVGHLSAEMNHSSYEDALYEHVLGPWGLDATRFGEQPDVSATGPDADHGRYPRARRPSGGLVSNVVDLLRFGERQLGEPSTAGLRSVVAKAPGGVYGLGLAGERVAGVDVWGHQGSYGGFQSALLLVPAHDAVFVGLTNSGRGKQALREIEDLWFERLLGARRRVAPTVALPAGAFEAFAGVYENGEATATVSPGGSGLTVELVEAETRVDVSARPVGPKTFEIVGGDFDGDRFDFPLDGFGRFGSRLAARVS